MPFLRKWIYSGNVIEAAEYYSLRTPKSISWPEIGKKPLRGKNCRITTEQQRKLNNRNAVLYFGRLLNANFLPADFFLTLDLAVVPLLENGEPDEKAIKAIIGKFLKKIRPKFKKTGIPWKYVWVIEKATEEKAVRPHVHMIVPKCSADMLMECWIFGGCCVRRLDATQDYRSLANYLSKDPTLGVNHQKRWGSSQNLVKPRVECKKIQYPGKEIKPPKGFMQIIDRSYPSDITGLIRYVRYVRIGGTDFAGGVLNGSRAGPDPIPISTG